MVVYNSFSLVEREIPIEALVYARYPLIISVFIFQQDEILPVFIRRKQRLFKVFWGFSIKRINTNLGVLKSR